METRNVCFATNAFVCAASDMTVPPEWRIEPKDMSITVGKTAVIDCQADAFPAARIEWRLSQGKLSYMSPRLCVCFVFVSTTRRYIV